MTDGLRRERMRSVTYLRFDLPGDPPWADDARVRPGFTAEEAARHAMDDLAGWMLATQDRALAEALAGEGARLVRHARVMAAPTGGAASPPDGELVELAEVAPAELLPSWKRAYAPPHPDHEAGDDARLLRDCLDVVFDPTFLGPLHPSSAALCREGEVVAAIVVKLREDDPPFGGPWVSDVWVDPALRGAGIGSALIRRALALLAEDGFATLGLAVTVGNPAQDRYAALGFAVEQEAWRLLLP